MKNANSIIFESPQFTLLSETQLQRLHQGALEVLRRTGVRFHHQEALDMLKKAGASISDDNLVKIPAHVVKNALSTVPGRIVMCDRDGAPAMFLEGHNCYFGTGSDTLNLLDPETGEHRSFTKADIIDGYRLCDALPHIHFVMSVGIPSNTEPAMLYDTQMALMLEHTTKPIVFVTNDKASCQRAIDMAAAVAGSHEALVEQQHILLYSEPSSPLEQSGTAVDKLLLMAEWGLPLVHSPAPMMGATGPITMAGGLVLATAEILSSIVLHQLRRPGAPFVFGSGVHHVDMHTGQIVYASPEFQLTRTAIAELGRWYGLPTWGYAGCSDTNVMDGQAAAEAMLSVTMSRFMGSNLIHDVGYMESGVTTSFEMIVLTDELAAMTEHLMKGIEVNDETMMIDELDRVGPGGQFMDAKETYNRFKDYWYPGFLEHKGYSKWLEDGSKTLNQRLNERVKEILKEYRAPELPSGKKQKIDEILERVKKH